MYFTIALLFFVISSADERAIAGADPSGLVRVSFDAGITWLPVALCSARPHLEWRAGDLVVRCDGEQRLDGDELRAHWQIAASTATAAETRSALISNDDLRRRARWRAWLPGVTVTARRAWSTGARKREVAITWLVLLRWRFGRPGPTD